MVTKLNVLNASRLLFMMLFTAVLFSSLHANAEDKKKFEINKTHTSAKAICEKKEFNATVEFDPKDYDGKDLKFNLIVGGCKLLVEAKKEAGGVLFYFYKEGKSTALDTVLNPKSFLVQEQSLNFKKADDVLSGFLKVCDDGFKFNPIEGQGNFTLEISLEGQDIPVGLVLKADNLVYDESESENANAMLWVWISVGVGSFLLIAVIVAIGVGICIKNRKKKTNTKNKLDALATAAPIAEESKMPVAQNVSVEQKPTSDSKPNTSTTKTSEPPQAKKQSSVLEVGKKPKANDPKAKNGQLEKTQKAKNDKASKKVSKKEELSLKTAVDMKSEVETKPAPSKQVEKHPTPMLKPVAEVKPDKKKNSKTEAKVKPKAKVQESARSRIYHRPEDEGSDHLSDDGEKPDKISPTVSVKTPTLSKDSKTRSRNSSTTECTSNTKTTLEESTAKSMDSTQESSKRSTLKSLDSTQETSSKRSITGSRTID